MNRVVVPILLCFLFFAACANKQVTNSSHSQGSKSGFVELSGSSGNYLEFVTKRGQSDIELQFVVDKLDNLNSVGRVFKVEFLDEHDFALFRLYVRNKACAGFLSYELAISSRDGRHHFYGDEVFSIQKDIYLRFARQEGFLSNHYLLHLGGETFEIDGFRKLEKIIVTDVGDGGVKIING